MSFWAVVFIVLMILWLFFGCYWGWPASPSPNSFGPILGNTIIPWACVAILGYLLLAGGGSTVIVR